MFIFNAANVYPCKRYGQLSFFVWDETVAIITFIRIVGILKRTFEGTSLLIHFELSLRDNPYPQSYVHVHRKEVKMKTSGTLLQKMLLAKMYFLHDSGIENTIECIQSRKST